MICFKRGEQIPVNAGDIIRIDNSCLCACFLFVKLCRLNCERIECTESDKCNITALLLNLVFIQNGIILCVLFAGRNHFATRNTDCNRVICLLNAPIKHRKILFFCNGSKINKIRNIRHHRNIKNAEMSNIVHTEHRSSKHDNCGRIAVYAQIL